MIGLRKVFLICWIVVLYNAVVVAQDKSDVIKRQFELPSGNKIWVYLPKKRQQETLPCVLIAPAGSRLYHGMHLASGDEAEHTPYVQAGFAVIAYEVSGALEDFETDAEAVLSFLKAEGGVLDAAAAFKLATAKVPEIDKEQVFVVGHSSAAIVALANARAFSMFKGCIVYCPPIDVKSALAPVMDQLSGEVPDFSAFVNSYSPMNNDRNYHCPVMVFHASDDNSSEDVRSFISLLRSNDNEVTHIEVPTGGHYVSMISEGIPLGISWMKSINRGDDLPQDVLPSPQENSSGGNSKLTTGNIIFFVCFGVGALVCILGQIVVLFDIFFKSPLWGCGSLIIPFVFPVFVLMNLDRKLTKIGGGLWIGGAIWMGASAVICNALGLI